MHDSVLDMRGFLYFGALLIVALIAADAGYPGGIWAGVLFVVIACAILDVENHLRTLREKNEALEQQLARYKQAPKPDHAPQSETDQRAKSAFLREWRRVSGQK